MSKTIKKPNYAIIEKDECANVVMFKIPLAAIYYGQRFHIHANETMIDIKNEEGLFAFALIMADGENDRALFTPDDKMDFIMKYKSGLKPVNAKSS